MKNVKMLLSLVIISLSMMQCKENKLNTTESKQEIKSETHEHKHDVKTDNKYISKEVKVLGEVENKFTLNVDSLKKMKVQDIGKLDIICQSGACVGKTLSAKGVLLRDILDKAKIIQKEHKDRNFYIVVRATDNYKATFSWAELYLNQTGDGVYLLFEQNGSPIDKEGEMVLVSTKDTKTGPRHTKWVSSIEVYRVD